MAEFTPIETQEQFDAIVKDRLARAEKAAAEKYSDYDAVKKQNADLATQIAQLNEQLKKQAETIDGNKAVVDDLTAKVHGYETASVKTKIALELGLPYQMADRLTGTDEESIRKDAESMVALIGMNKPKVPLGNPEPDAGGDPKDAVWKKFAASLSKDQT